MDLLEYQAKNLFQQVGIPVLPSETIADSSALKLLTLNYPIVLKSQVRVGGRGKAGGIRFVTNTIDAIAAARAIFNLSILGEHPEVILAESHYDAQTELFLGIVLDYQLQQPVLFGSVSGGMDTELLRADLQKVPITQEFSPFLAKRLGVKMGLSGDLLLGVSNIIEKMYGLFISKDLDLIEINPLGVNLDGELMALDGKMTVNKNALHRHPELANLARKSPPLSKSHQKTKLQITEAPVFNYLDWHNPKGKIAILTDDRDLALVCWDLIKQEKEKPACAIVVSPQLPKKEDLQEQMEQVFDFLFLRKTKILLVNFWNSDPFYRAIVQALCQMLPDSDDWNPDKILGDDTNIVPINKTSSSKVLCLPSTTTRNEARSIEIVIRFANTDLKLYREECSHKAIHWHEDLDYAVIQAISLAKTK